MKVTKNLWNIKTERGQIVRADKIWSFSKRFFPNFPCLSLTVKWLNAKRKCWSNGKSSDHSTRDSSSPFLSFSFHVRPMKGSRESGFWNSRNFVCEIWNPGLWNPEYRARNADYTNDYNPESKVPGSNIESGIQYLESGIQSEESRIQDQGRKRGAIRGTEKVKWCLPFQFSLIINNWIVIVHHCRRTATFTCVTYLSIVAFFWILSISPTARPTCKR